MRVLQVMAGAEFGGAEAFFVRLVLGLHRAGLDQRVVIRNHPHRAEALKRGGVEPVELAFGGRFDLATPRALKKIVKEYRPHVVLTWMNRATRMCPKGDFVHVARLGGYYDLKYYKACDHLIGNTEDIVDYLVGAGWPREKAHYLPNFVGEERADPVPRNTFFTPDRAPLILALGRLHENKAFDVLLDAVARLPDAYLWLAGEGPLRRELEGLAEKLGIKPRVRFLGWREDIPALFAACDLFVCPSRLEPLGNVVVEAWAQGVPVVATDSLGPGILIEDGETGLLSPVDDPPALARAMALVLGDENLRTRIARQGRSVFEDHFTEAVVTDTYRNFFAGLVR